MCRLLSTSSILIGAGHKTLAFVIVICGLLQSGCAQDPAIHQNTATNSTQTQPTIQNASINKADYPDIFGKVQTEAPETQVLSAEEVHQRVEELEAQNKAILTKNKKNIDARIY